MSTPAKRLAALEANIARLERRLGNPPKLAYRATQEADVSVRQREIWNFTGGTAVTDDPENGRTNVAMSCTGWPDFTTSIYSETFGAGAGDWSSSLWTATDFSGASASRAGTDDTGGVGTIAADTSSAGTYIFTPAASGTELHDTQIEIRFNITAMGTDSDLYVYVRSGGGTASPTYVFTRRNGFSYIQLYRGTGRFASGQTWVTNLANPGALAIYAIAVDSPCGRTRFSVGVEGGGTIDPFPDANGDQRTVGVGDDYRFQFTVQPTTGSGSDISIDDVGLWTP